MPRITTAERHFLDRELRRDDFARMMASARVLPGEDVTLCEQPDEWPVVTQGMLSSLAKRVAKLKRHLAAAETLLGDLEEVKTTQGFVAHQTAMLARCRAAKAKGVTL